MWIVIPLGILGISVAAAAAYFTSRLLVRRNANGAENEPGRSKTPLLTVVMTIVGGLMIFGIALAFAYLPGSADRGWEVALVEGLSAMVLLVIAAVVGRSLRHRN